MLQSQATASFEPIWLCDWAQLCKDPRYTEGTLKVHLVLFWLPAGQHHSQSVAPGFPSMVLTAEISLLAQSLHQRQSAREYSRGLGRLWWCGGCPHTRGLCQSWKTQLEHGCTPTCTPFPVTCSGYRYDKKAQGWLKSPIKYRWHKRCRKNVLYTG